MSLSSTPFLNNGADLFSSIHQQADVLAEWTLPARFALAPDTNGHIVPELVNALGVATCNRRFFYFEGLYNEFVARGSDEIDVLKSFIRALTFRRCRSVELLSPILGKIFRNPLLDTEDWEDIASIVADLNSYALVNELVNRSSMATRQHRPCFYSHLMRFAAEQLEAPCLSLAMVVVDAMNATGATWTEATMYHLLGVFCRIKDHMPYATILHLVTEWRDARLREDGSSTFPTLIMSRVLSLTERALGPDIATARAIMDIMGGRDEWNRCIEMLGAHYDYVPPPPGDQRGCYLIDPTTIDVSTLCKIESPEFVLYSITFSNLRALCERAEFLSECHRIFTSVLLPIRKLFQEFHEKTVVVPPDIELSVRVGGVDEKAPVQRNFDHICYKCVALKPPTMNLYGHRFTQVKSAAHDCGLPNVLPACSPLIFAHIIKCCVMLYPEPMRKIKVLTTNKTIINELVPLMDQFSSSWFEVCAQIAPADEPLGCPSDVLSG